MRNVNHGNLQSSSGSALTFIVSACSIPRYPELSRFQPRPSGAPLKLVNNKPEPQPQQLTGTGLRFFFIDVLLNVSIRAFGLRDFILAASIYESG